MSLKNRTAKQKPYTGTLQVEHRPSGAWTVSGNLFVKHHNRAGREASLLKEARARMSGCRHAFVPEVILFNSDVIVMERANATPLAENSSVQTHVATVLRALNTLHANAENSKERLCSEEAYREYAHYPDDWVTTGGLSKQRSALRAFFQSAMDRLHGEVVKRLGTSVERTFVHGDCTLSNLFVARNVEPSRNTHPVICMVDFSIKASPGLPEVDISKLLFSVLGFDVGYQPSVANALMDQKSRLRAIYRHTLSDAVIAYFLASHVLRVARKEMLSLAFLTQVQKAVLQLAPKLANESDTTELPKLHPLHEVKAILDEKPNYDLLVVTDMDGTLLDSREATVAAYRKAGFEFDPAVHWGKSAVDNGIPPEAHQKKTAIWPEFVDQLALLPAARVVRDLQEDYDILLLTGASPVTRSLGLSRLATGVGLAPDFVVDSATRDKKVATLKAILSFGQYQELMYLDDDKEFLGILWNELSQKERQRITLVHV